MVKTRMVLLIVLFGASLPLKASFIEATMGTALVNDATSIYHNPAAMLLVEKNQLVLLGTSALYESEFFGETHDSLNHDAHVGTSREQTNYYLPSAYLLIPLKTHFRLGLALLKDAFNSDIHEPSILRYVQANHQVNNRDYLGSIAMKLNQFLSLGAGLSYSSARFISNPIIGFPQLDIPDSQGHNQSYAQQWGWQTGLVVTLSKATLLGFDYRSVVAYQFRGSSFLQDPIPVRSSDYGFNFWTPPKSVLTLSQALTPSLRLISTLSFIQWSVFKTITYKNIATKIDASSLILPRATVPYYSHDSWMATLGTINKISSHLVLRIASTYLQSPGNPRFRIVDGDSFILGGSIGYTINKSLNLDVGLAHAFIENQTINMTTRRIKVRGINSGQRNSLSLKLSFNLDG